MLHNVLVFFEFELIGRFCALWPSLSELHKWFFIIVFENIQDKRMVLCNLFWCWEDQNVLMLKPWHPNFRPDSEGFDKVPIWVRLPYFPLHLWFNSCLEAIGNTLGEFLMVDEGSSNFLPSTYARVLVEMNISSRLPTKNEATVIGSGHG